MKICKYSNKYKCIDQCSQNQPWYKLTKPASRIIYDHSHKQIIKRIPYLCYKKHRSDKSRRYFNDICKIDHGKRSDHSIDQIFSQSAKGKRIFNPAWDLALINHITYFLLTHNTSSCNFFECCFFL